MKGDQKAPAAGEQKGELSGVRMRMCVRGCSTLGDDSSIMNDMI